MLRVPGKPFVVSEFNSGQPNDYGAESLLMAATTAAHQDWAGVWVFDYHGAGDWSRNAFEGFFSIDSHPLKMATAPGGGFDFSARRRGGGHHPDHALFSRATASGTRSRALRRGLRWGRISRPGAASGAPPVAAFSGRVGTQRDTGVFVAPSLASLSNPGRWVSAIPAKSPATAGAGWFRLDSPRSKVWVGPTSGQSLQIGELRGLFGATSNVPWSTGALSSLDGMPLDQSKRMLLVTAGKRREHRHGLESPQRTSVGANWGSGPDLRFGARRAVGDC